MSEARSKLAACVLLVKDDKVFLAKRKNTDWANGQWNIPGGTIERGETARDAAVRELNEEIGVTIDPATLQFHQCVHFIQDEFDVVTFHFIARQWNGDAVNNEPNKISDTDWFAFDALPPNIIEHSKNIIKAISTDHEVYVPRLTKGDA